MRKILISIVITLLVGCAESNFELASDSRLPRWFTLAEGLERSDVIVTLSYNFKPSGRYAVFEIESTGERYREKVKGKQRGPYTLEIDGSQRQFEVFTINDVTEVVEHSDVESVFYVTEIVRS
ncbi:MAG: hypothetical protein ACI9J2_000754 [Saprospiraceae bacterium]|jgi:hypothetical protein